MRKSNQLDHGHVLVYTIDEIKVKLPRESLFIGYGHVATCKLDRSMSV